MTTTIRQRNRSNDRSLSSKVLSKKVLFSMPTEMMNEIQPSTLNSHTNTYDAGDRSTLKDDLERSFRNRSFRHLQISNMQSNEQIMKNTNDKTTITENVDYTNYYTKTNNLNTDSVWHGEEMNFLDALSQIDAILDTQTRE